MISVALCVYNGERFLTEQLNSIKNQTLPVNELVVCDDCSTDSTYDIITAFGKEVSFPVRYYKNDKQLGSTKNFEKCLKLCTGDIIFLCDQDDAWLPEKVAKQVAYLNQHPDKMAVFSDGGLMDAQSKPIAGSVWGAVSFDAKAQEQWLSDDAYKLLYRGYVVTGATLAIRASILSTLTPFPDGIKEMIHDSWMTLILTMNNQIGFINEPLINYRRHASQQVGFGTSQKYVTFSDRFKRPRAEKIAPLVKELTKLKQLYALLADRKDIPSTKLSVLTTLITHLENRVSLPQNRLVRVPFVAIELLKGNYYDPQKHWWKTVLGDLLE